MKRFAAEREKVAKIIYKFNKVERVVQVNFFLSFFLSLSKQSSSQRSCLVGGLCVNSFFNLIRLALTSEQAEEQSLTDEEFGCYLKRSHLVRLGKGVLQERREERIACVNEFGTG